MGTPGEDFCVIMAVFVVIAICFYLLYWLDKQRKNG